MKKLALVSVLALSLAACSQNAQNESAEAANATAPGSRPCAQIRRPRSAASAVSERSSHAPA